MKLMRLIKFILIIMTSSIILIFVRPGQGAAVRLTVSLQETGLWSGGSAAGLHVGSDGSIFLLDRNDEIWKVKPETGQFQGYYGMSGTVLFDLSLQNDDLVWWTDESQIFGSLNTSTDQIKYWDHFFEAGDDEYWNNYPQLGPITYENELVWMSEWMGVYFGFLKFDSITNEICSYKVSIHAADMIMFENDLWALDWFEDALLRFDPVTGQLVKFSYQDERQIGMDSNLQTDGSLLWWAETSPEWDIASFDPDSRTMTTYSLPVGEQPHHLSLRAGKVWYTNSVDDGSFGRLDPGVAGGTSTILPEVIVKNSITPVCKYLSSPSLETAIREPAYGTTTYESTKIEPYTGLLSYSLPDDALPLGIASTMDDIWVSDPGRQKLIRMPLAAQEAFITVRKLVINDDGGDAQADDFNLTLAGTPVFDGIAVTVDPGTYTVGETLLGGYTFIGFSGDCDANGQITVGAGESKICVLTNDDVNLTDDYEIYLPLIIK